MKSKKSHDYSEIINVLVLIAIVVLFVAVYLAGTGKNGLKSVAIKTEQAYVKKAEDIKAAKNLGGLNNDWDLTYHLHC